ncbi:PR5-like receptor kinase [Apium graveolens]|uniref:PR5-like receptor kinase n=1 Tax=Apium graveolens TaxID=4045 RepID=UPI003D794042
MILMAAGTLAAGLLITAVLLFCFWSKCSSIKYLILSKSVRDDREKVEAFLKLHGNHTPKRFRYKDIKKMTQSFKSKLGQGGYGGVYKGNLPDNSAVAVKILNTSKSNGEEFLNEVASISRTSHVNIVSLIGFCFEGSKRALVYEYMPNGSLEKFISNGKSSSVQLGWHTLSEIALGIARGLEYLHRGCSIRILHFDIKPHNILLDEEFCPKISDFGLAKLCLGKESIISMQHMRGTPGYIAPEVFSRNFGGVSHKSDVYSYGMMILEMVGAKTNTQEEINNCSSEKYFPNWIYDRLELNADQMGLDDISNEVENQSTKKLLIVGLWCIQTHPSERPSMKGVLEMLEGNVESLKIPTRPFLESTIEPLDTISTT